MTDEPAPVKTPAEVQKEMAFTTYGESCRDKTIFPDGELRECRRPFRHKRDGTNHASGFEKGYREWPDLTERNTK